MAICQVCGKVNTQGARSCDMCGAQLPESTPAMPGQIAGVNNFSGPICPVCQRINRSASAFCSYCGYRLKPQVPDSKQQAAHHAAQQPSIPADVTGNLPSGTVLKRRYRILRKIAQGGMGAVYESTDLGAPHGPRWAVKEISPASLPAAERAQAIADFRREAQMLATLQHPNLPQVVETFEELGKHFLVMEFIPGRTLLNVIDGTPGFVTEERITVWARQLFEVLHYLHSQDPPIVYRDLKPANIMLVEGTERIKLIDFGIARFHKAGKSRDTEAFGTAGYAPPEQYGKGQTDQRSDIYALAATMHHLVTEHDPSLSPFNWLPVRRYNANLSTRLESALQRALSLDPMMRFASMKDFALALGIVVADAGREQVQVSTSPAPMTIAPQHPVDTRARPSEPVITVAPAQPKSQPRKRQPIYQPVAPVPPFPAVTIHTAPAMSVAAQLPTQRANSGPPSHDIMTPTEAMKPPMAPQVQPSQAALVVSDRLVDLGEAKWNSKPARKISLRSIGTGNVRGSVVASHPWIAYNPRHFQGNSVTLEVKVKKQELPFGRLELQVPNLFAIIWTRFRRILPLVGCWFWVLFLAASSFGLMVWYALAAIFVGLLLSEGLIWLWAMHVRMLVPTNKLNTGRLVVKSSGGEEQIDVRVMAHPSMVRKALGWVLSVLFLAAEIGAVVWIGLTLIVGHPLGVGALQFIR